MSVPAQQLGYEVGLRDLTRPGADLNLAPTVSAGPDQNVNTGTGSVTRLMGRVSDVGLQGDSGLTWRWTQASGPGVAVFNHASDLRARVTLPATGTYIFTLTGTNQEFSATDNITIVLGSGGGPTNYAPNVNAGPDQSFIGVRTIALNGSITDDGLPTGTLTHSWTLTSGASGSVSIASAANLSTNVTFSGYGTFVFTLTASDSVLSSTDTVTVSVLHQTEDALDDIWGSFPAGGGVGGGTGGGPIPGAGDGGSIGNPNLTVVTTFPPMGSSLHEGCLRFLEVTNHVVTTIYGGSVPSGAQADVLGLAPSTGTYYYGLTFQGFRAYAGVTGHHSTRDFTPRSDNYRIYLLPMS